MKCVIYDTRTGQWLIMPLQAEADSSKDAMLCDYIMEKGDDDGWCMFMKVLMWIRSAIGAREWLVCSILLRCFVKGKCICDFGGRMDPSPSSMMHWHPMAVYRFSIADHILEAVRFMAKMCSMFIAGYSALDYFDKVWRSNQNPLTLT